MTEQRRCRFCGAAVSAEARYCDRCGTPLTADAAAHPTLQRKWYRRPFTWAAVALVVAMVAGTVGGLHWRRSHAQPVQTPTPIANEKPPVDDQAKHESQMLALYRQSVVSIHVKGSAGDRSGSGFAMDDKGHVVTAAHLVNGVEGCVSVTDDSGKAHSGTLLGLDDRRDVALLHVPDLPVTVGHLELGQSAGLKSGDEIYVLGNPTGMANGFSLPASVTRVGDEATIDERYYANLLQFSGVSVVAGTSGGPLLSKATGEVVGVVTAGSNAPIAWAIPIDDGKELVKQWAEIPPGQPCTMPTTRPTVALQLATITPLSGSSAVEGADLADGAELAIRDMAPSLKLVGYEVTLKRFDDAANAATARDRASTAAFDPKVIGVVGSFDSPVTAAIAERLLGAAMPIVAPTASADDLATHGWTHFTRIVATAQRQEQAIARFAKDSLGVKAAYILDDGTPEAARQSSAFRTSAQVIGLNIAGSSEVSPAADAAALHQQITAAKADAVYVAGSSSTALKVVEALRKDGVSAPILSSQSLAGRSMESLTVAGVYFTRVTAEPGEQFKRHFEAALGKPSRGYAQYGYDAATAILTALVKYGETHRGTVPPRSDLAALVRQITGLTGASAPSVPISFDAQGENLTSLVYVYEWTKGKAQLRRQMK